MESLLGLFLTIRHGTNSFIIRQPMSQMHWVTQFDIWGYSIP